MSNKLKYQSDNYASRLGKVLQGAFGGPPTPLKDIPTQHGESRAPRRSQRAKQKSAIGNRKRKKA